MTSVSDKDRNGTLVLGLPGTQPEPLAAAAGRALDRAWLQDDPAAYRAGVDQLVRELSRAGAAAPDLAAPPRTGPIRQAG